MRDRGAGTQARTLRPRGAARDPGGSLRAVRPGRPRSGRSASAGSGGDRACLPRARAGGGDGCADLCRPGDHASHSFRRFNTRFFLGDGSNVFGEPAATEELEGVGWHLIGREALDSFRDVTRFMLARAIASARDGTASGAAPRSLLGQERPPHRRVPARARPALRTRRRGEMATDGNKISLAVLAGDGIGPEITPRRRSLLKPPLGSLALA